MEHKLTAILATDVLGCSRLMSKDDAESLAALKACETEVIEPTVSKHNGRIFKKMGDCYLSEFASAIDVAECALDWQRKQSERAVASSDAMSANRRVFHWTIKNRQLSSISLLKAPIPKTP